MFVTKVVIVKATFYCYCCRGRESVCTSLLRSNTFPRATLSFYSDPSTNACQKSESMGLVIQNQSIGSAHTHENPFIVSMKIIVSR